MYKICKGSMKLILVLILIIALLGTACSKTAQNDEQIEGPTSMVIKDHLGREIEIDKPVETIVSGYYITTSLLIALGLKDNIVGLESKPEMRPIYSLAAPELLDLPSVGTLKEFNIEATVALNPDLIIVSSRLKDSVETMEKLGFKVIAVNPEDEQLLNETILMVGKATNRTEVAEKLIEYNNNKANMIKDLVKDKERKDVYLGGNSNFLLTASSKMYQNSLIELAGGRNVAEDIDDTYWAEISYEQLIIYNPDIIVGVPSTTYTKEDVLTDSRLVSLDAVKNKDVYFMPANLENWDSPIPSGILGSLWMTSVLHEDVYSFDEFKEDAFEFYKEFYNIEIDKDELSK